ncbi:MAG: bifunctional chorismate mutase/prephenate dehydratase, partial [Lachnospiraceae bacterium]|nr:bifunctional chorismate mutase/prephenate dehydratase [Lachnospiraceae bacterium]
EVCEKIADYKIETGKKVFDKTREEEKLDKVASFVDSDFDKMAVRELFSQIMSVSRKLQYQKLAEKGVMGRLPFIQVQSLFDEPGVDPQTRNSEGTVTGIDHAKARVVFQGAEGSYSQAAMEKYFGKDVSSFHVDTFREAMSAIDEGSADFGVLPIENSTAGIVNEIYDLLVEFENYIVAEQIIPIEHCLLGLPGTDLSRVKKVYSHPQSLMQSADFLSEYRWEQVGLQNNAFAAMKVRDDKDPTKVAVASEYAGQYYGLEVLQKGINSRGGNSTRFIIITNQKVFLSGANKISLCFELPHRSGALYHLLSHFIYNNLNLTRIESRPIPEKDWEYRFFVDFEGNLSDGAVKNALRGLRDEAKNMKILGNY